MIIDERVIDLYKDYDVMPYISQERNIEHFLKEVEISKSKLVPKKNMIYVDREEKILPGHIILLWRINFGTYTNETIASKYFEYTYGINASEALNDLINNGYAIRHLAKESLQHLSISILKNFLKTKNVKNISKMNAEDVRNAVISHFSNVELENLFSVRAISLTTKGQKMLEKGQEIVDKHPKKKF